MKPYRNLPKLEYFEPYTGSNSPRARTVPADERYENLSPRQLTISWICRFIAGAIMIETLFFKFTGAPESIYIFSKMHMEPWWRYGQGIWELTASLLLLARGSAWAGGILTLGAMGAAIMSHLTILGIQIRGDHGLLFSMALVSFSAALITTLIHRYEIPGYAPATN